MLACIACSSKEGGDDSSRGGAATPHSKDAVRSLTSQLKDMMLKFSGSSKHYKVPGSPSFRGRSPYPGFIDDTTFMPTKRPGGDACAYTRTTTTTSRSIEEWTAQVEPGVQITFVTLAGGGNDLKRIRFSREVFNKWEAQRWWGENYDRIVELYNVQMFSGRQQGASTPTSSVDDSSSVLRESSYSRGGSTRESPAMAPPPPSSSTNKDPIARSVSCRAAAAAPSFRPAFYPSAAVPDPSDHVWAHHFNMLNSAAAAGASIHDLSRATTSSRDEASVSMSNVSDLEATEWIEQDEPGVCLTIRELGDGTRELRRVRFSRERFGEDRAKVWWEQNRERIQAQYL